MSTQSDLPISVRNRNPGNLRAAYGMNYPTTLNEGFAVFRHPVDGWQALASLTGDYYQIKGLRTLKSFIATYAPATENDVQAYCNEVCKLTSWNPLQIDTADIHLWSPWRAQALMLAISRVEGGATAITLPTAPYWWRMSDVFTGIARSNRWSHL